MLKMGDLGNYPTELPEEKDVVVDELLLQEILLEIANDDPIAANHAPNPPLEEMPAIIPRIITPQEVVEDLCHINEARMCLLKPNLYLFLPVPLLLQNLHTPGVGAVEINDDMLADLKATSQRKLVHPQEMVLPRNLDITLPIFETIPLFIIMKI